MPHESIEFDGAVYQLDAIKKAAYRFSDRFSPEISVDGKRIVCSLSFPPNTPAALVASLVSEFRKEVLDQDLRQSVAKETAALRNAVLALAFAPVQHGKV